MINKQYRTRRKPGDNFWFIEIREPGLFNRARIYPYSEVWAGSALYETPVFCIRYFDSKDEAQDFIDKLIAADNDGGEIGQWQP